MKKMFLLWGLLGGVTAARAQYFNEETKQLYRAAVEANDTLHLYRIRQDIAAVDI